MTASLKIDFVSDVSCPWCVIGLKALDQAIERVGADITVNLVFDPPWDRSMMSEEAQLTLGL